MKVSMKLILITIFIFCSRIGIAATIYVPGDLATIQTGIDAASDGDVVMVADGTYTGLGNKDIEFKGKKITVQSENGPFLCIIDCQGIGRGFHFQGYETNESVLSGFTIRNANWDKFYTYGGGIRCSYSAPTITNCIIDNCQAGQWGGGVSIMGDAGSVGIPIISNSIITNNWALVGGGGICAGAGGEVMVVNCTLVGNDCGPDGSTFCTGAAGLSLGNPGYATIVNSIFWNGYEDKREIGSVHAPPSVTYSLIKGGFDGEGNIACDPLYCDPGFLNSSADDYRLIADSLCIDTGNNSAPQIPVSDIEGNPRIIDGDGDGTATVDMGADEYVGALSHPLTRLAQPWLLLLLLDDKSVIP